MKTTLTLIILLLSTSLAVAHEYDHNIDYASISDFNSYPGAYRENHAIRHVNNLRLVDVEGELRRYQQDYLSVAPWYMFWKDKFKP